CAIRSSNIKSNVGSPCGRRQTHSEGGRYSSAISFRDRYIIDRKIRRTAASAVVGGRIRIAWERRRGEKVRRVVVRLSAAAGFAEIGDRVVAERERRRPAPFVTVVRCRRSAAVTDEVDHVRGIEWLCSIVTGAIAGKQC